MFHILFYANIVGSGIIRLVYTFLIILFADDVFIQLLKMSMGGWLLGGSGGAVCCLLLMMMRGQRGENLPLFSFSVIR